MKTCINCIEFTMRMPEEYRPEGSEWPTCKCYWGIWEMDARDDERAFGSYIKMAEECDKYVED